MEKAIITVCLLVWVVMGLMSPPVPVNNGEVIVTGAEAETTTPYYNRQLHRWENKVTKEKVDTEEFQRVYSNRK